MLKNDSEADQIDLKSRLKSVENTRIMRDHRKVMPDTFNEGENGTKPEQIESSEISTPDTPQDNITELETADEVQDAENNIVDLNTMQPESASSEPLLSELIMPDGDKLNVDRLRKRIGDSRAIEHKRVVLPDSVESIWEKTLKEITQLETEEVISPDVEEIPIPKLSFIERITKRFKREKIVLEDYDLEKHGILVDLSLPENFPYDEVEVYEVNEPYAYVRVVYNPNTHSHLYQTLEPKLSEGEKQLFAELKMRLSETLDVNLTQLEKSGAKKYLREKVIDILWDYQIKIDTISFTKIMYFLFTEFMGYGIIDPLMHDSNLEDVSCDGPHSSLFVYHRKYDSIEADIKFDDESKLDGFVTRIAQICGRHISIADPLLDATMPDGSRIQLTLGREVTTRGSSFTIRKFKESPLTPPDLIDFHTYSTSIAAYLWLAAENNKNLIFAGGTASGKTTSMNAIALFIPPETKIVSIEDTRELNLPHPNWIAGVTRETFTGGEAGSIDMYDLLRAALRQRPEFLLVGEVRGEEAYVLFQAMSTGHTTFSTMHADSVQSVVHRLENPPINVPRIMLQALDVVIIQVQVRVGEERVRRAKSVTEIVGVDARTGELLTNEVFTWNASKDEFFYSGRSYVFESIMQNRGWNDERLQDELKRRQEILEWARMKNVKHYEDVAKIVVTYYREPGTLMEIVRKELYGN
ncbi:MAG: type II/IV secretion system ATPase subunit [ANME-2 cluster archaeon]|jgi:flagellar protein FlaI|nr:type II/IV secretion system ATPase subunit [ANME-2 cluster archaeon]